MIIKLAWLALAGALGTLARYGLAQVVHRVNGAPFPFENLVVNLTGCFVAGIMWALFESRWPVGAETRVLVLIGFMGAFTTFSAFILETTQLMQSQAWVSALANIMLQNGLGFAALFAGAAIARHV